MPTPSVALTIIGSLYLEGIADIAEKPPMPSLTSFLVVFAAKGFMKFTRASPLFISTPDTL